MQIDTSALATLKAFNQFATSAVKDSDIARIDSSRPQGASLNITKATGDRAWWALTRSTASKIDNNAVRFAFQNAINSLFGGEENIPQSVKDVMKLDDYGKGRPLTARRITAVTTAISQALKDAGPLSDQSGFSIRTEDVMRGIGTAKELSPKEANKELRESFASTEPISKSGMPMAFANELRGILNEAYTRFRGAPPANEPCARDFVGGSLSTEINALIDKANKEGRRLTLEEFSAAAHAVRFAPRRFHKGLRVNMKAVAVILAFVVFSAHVEALASVALAGNAYTNHAGNVVSGVVVALDARTTTISNAMETVKLPLSIFPESEQRRIVADFVLGQGGGQVGLLRVPVAVKRAITGAEKAMARSRKRAEKGLCTQEESDAFCEKSASALKSYLDKQVKEGTITPAERKALGR